MTTLPSIGFGTARAMMDRRLDSAVSVGALRAEDKAALSVALDTVGQGLAAKADTPPASMKDRVNALIAGQVEQGTLSPDQAGELERFFSPEPDRQAPAPDAVTQTPTDTDAAKLRGVKTASEQIASFEALLGRMRASMSPTNIYGSGSAPQAGLVINQDA
ncbi:hypothetical protein [uncultured Sphingomonas sp.]|uniref:hypothetical protein n=1 Tax=uncultured Sphingomonas sp. TaxID=158754 RepID=UPI00374A42EA